MQAAASKPYVMAALGVALLMTAGTVRRRVAAAGAGIAAEGHSGSRSSPSPSPSAAPSAERDLQQLWSTCASAFRLPSGPAFVVDARAGVSALPLPPEFVGAVAFSLSGYNPHGTTASGMANAAANVALEAALAAGLAPFTPTAVVHSFSFDAGVVSWLERGFTLLFPADAVTPELQRRVLALALRFRQSGCVTDPPHP
jgi:hypothetical protein